MGRLTNSAVVLHEVCEFELASLIGCLPINMVGFLGSVAALCLEGSLRCQ